MGKKYFNNVDLQYDTHEVKIIYIWESFSIDISWVRVIEILLIISLSIYIYI